MEATKPTGALAEIEAKLETWRDSNPVRKWRKAVGARLGTIARQCGCSRNSVINWEQGHCKPDAGNMQALAHVMQIEQIELETKWANWLRTQP